MKHSILFLIVLMLLAGCEKITYYPDKDIPVYPTRKLAHRGGGNAQFRDNTLAGIRSALSSVDGIEVDVQLSKDRSIWLSHPSDVIACEGTLQCFSETYDTDIRAISTCQGKDISYTNLEEVLRLMRDSFPDKEISIDLKAWPVCGAGGINIQGCMNLEAEAILNLARKYGLEEKLKFETETAAVLNFIRSKKTSAGIYLTTFGDLERAMLLCLDQGYTGISYKNNVGEELTKEKIGLLHRKGLRIMVWNFYSREEADKLTEMGVDYLQPDL